MAFASSAGRWAGAAAALGEEAERQISHGRLQRVMAFMAAFAAGVSGFEAWTQHVRGAFGNRWMWTPVLLTPPLVAAAGAGIFSRRAAKTVLPAVSAVMLADGVIGFALHLRGVRRLPGGFKFGAYNVAMGPPLFAPLLLTTAGILGLLAAVLRPEELPREVRIR